MATVQAQNNAVASIPESEATHVLIAEGRSGNWTASLDESLADQQTYRLQLESPSITMSIPLQNLDELAALSQWLRSDDESVSPFTLEPAEGLPFRICRNRDTTETLIVSLGGYPFPMLQSTICGSDVRELSAAIQDCLADSQS